MRVCECQSYSAITYFITYYDFISEASLDISRPINKLTMTKLTCCLSGLFRGDGGSDTELLFGGCLSTRISPHMNTSRFRWQKKPSLYDLRH